MTTEDEAKESSQPDLLDGPEARDERRPDSEQCPSPETVPSATVATDPTAGEVAAAVGEDSVGEGAAPALTASRTRPAAIADTRPPADPTGSGRKGRARKRRPSARFGLVNRWDGLGYTPLGGHLRWLPEPVKDLVREVWELLPGPARSVVVAIWRGGRALRRFI